MNGLFHLFLLSIAANLDNLGVGVAYGVKRIKVPPLSNLIIATIAFLFGCISVIAGTYIGHFLSDATANAIGAILIIGVGIWVMLPPKKVSAKEDAITHDPPLFIEILHEPEQADRDHSAVISWQESILLGVALSINVFTNGISAGLWKLDVIATAFSMAVFSYATIWIGTWLGSRYGARWLGNKANIAAGILLILIGLHQVL
jgi:putative sporulation protein YtaF